MAPAGPGTFSGTTTAAGGPRFSPRTCSRPTLRSKSCSRARRPRLASASARAGALLPTLAAAAAAFEHVLPTSSLRFAHATHPRVALKHGDAGAATPAGPRRHCRAKGPTRQSTTLNYTFKQARAPADPRVPAHAHAHARERARSRRCEGGARAPRAPARTRPHACPRLRHGLPF